MDLFNCLCEFLAGIKYLLRTSTPLIRIWVFVNLDKRGNTALAAFCTHLQLFKAAVKCAICSHQLLKKRVNACSLLSINLDQDM